MKRTRIPVVVDFSNESKRRSGWVELSQRDDTIVIHQSLQRTEQWESDAPQTVYVPRSVMMEFISKLE